MIAPVTWYPAPLTPAENAAAVAASDAAAQVERNRLDPWAGHLTPDDERVWR